jgi:hypothetical protein
LPDAAVLETLEVGLGCLQAGEEAPELLRRFLEGDCDLEQDLDFEDDDVDSLEDGDDEDWDDDEEDEEDLLEPDQTLIVEAEERIKALLDKLFPQPWRRCGRGVKPALNLGRVVPPPLGGGW